MNSKNILKSLNLTDGEVLTLEKLNDRMEFQAVFMMPENKAESCTCYGGGVYIGIACPINCDSVCPHLTLNPCDCDGPVGYINCHPYRG